MLFNPVERAGGAAAGNDLGPGSGQRPDHYHPAD